MVEVGHTDGASLRNTFAVEAQSRIPALPGQIPSREDYLGAESNIPS